MITKEQYLEIIDTFEKYTDIRTKMFPDKPLTDDFVYAFSQALSLIEGLVEKD